VRSANANAFEFGPRAFGSGEILLPPLIFPQSDSERRADSRWALPQISRLFMFCYKFFVKREICEMCWPIDVKFCTMVSTMPNFILPVQIFWGVTPPKNFKSQKHAKFGPISDDFEVRRRISPERMKIFKIG